MMPQPMQAPQLAPASLTPNPYRLRVAASSLLAAGLLGACASSGQPVMEEASQAQSAPAPAAAAGESGLPIIATLKNAETALTDYARSRHRESGLREAAQAAETAALVARHRYSIGAADYLAVSQAESRLTTARQALEAGETATQIARSRLYRVFGLGSEEARRDGSALSLPVSSQAEPQPFAQARVL
jgi:hypothetical protein